MQTVLFVTSGREQPLIDLALQFGYLEAYLVYSVSEKNKLDSNYQKKLSESSDLSLLFALDVKTAEEAKIRGFDGLFQLGTRNATLFPGVTHVYNNEYEEEKDFIHQRRSGLNHVLLATLQKNDVTVVLNLTGLQTLDRPKLLGRLMINKKLTQKKGVASLTCTIAKETTQLRGARDVAAFSRLLE